MLVVDDYPDTVNAFAQLVSILGHECMTATTARDALALIASFQPDICLVDLGLPEIDGCTLARRIRRVHGSAIRLVAVTGWSGLRDKALASGFDDFVVKPLDLSMLRRLLGSGHSFGSSDLATN